MQKTIIFQLKNNSKNIYTVRQKVPLKLIFVGKETADFSLIVNLIEPGSTVDILGLIVGKGSSVIKLETYQNHMALKTVSHLLLFSIMNGSSQFNFKGNIHISKKAPFSDAYLKNDNLIMSDQAIIESRPNLEVLNNNVYCSHGVTISHINEDQLFYLTSRGLDESSSNQLLIRAFISGILDKVRDGKHKHDLLAFLER